MDWLHQRLTGNEAATDVQATLLELTCRSIADCIRQQCSGAQEIYVCGGGAHNATLMKRLSALLPDSLVETTQAVGVDADYLEAIAFAWLAEQAMHRHPANLPAVTGARHPCILGAIYPA
ncbi:MAG: anhydro-N-acetylmuramic acid kinase, partial [Gallionella sp.]|nr:anhydro-N-acetylmuramic acid kinase [Gallionella sp.]